VFHLRGQLDHFVENADAKAAGREFAGVGDELLHDKVQHGSLEHPDQQEQHVVALLVEGQVHDVSLNGFEDYLDFFLSVYDLHKSLHRVGANVVTRDDNEVFGEVLEDLKPLLAARVENKLLAEVVCVVVNEELGQVVLYLVDYQLDHAYLGFFNIVLHNNGSFMSFD
jgi:hypothetical protein